MLENFEYKATAVFLRDQMHPRRLLMMRRGEDRALAPSRWTGPGGKFDDGETEAACASRELGEETNPPLRPALRPIGRLIINGKRLVSLFTGTAEAGLPPTSNEGELHWVPIEEVFNRDILPTTRRFLQEWASRGWTDSKPFTMKCTRDGDDNVDAPVQEAVILEGLVW